jgi:hypothetical protein
MTIHGIPGSYVEKWAKECKVSFVWYTLSDLIVKNRKNEQFKTLCNAQFAELNPTKKLIRLTMQTSDETKSMRPQDRPELNPIDYKFP